MSSRVLSLFILVLGMFLIIVWKDTFISTSTEVKKEGAILQDVTRWNYGWEIWKEELKVMMGHNTPPHGIFSFWPFQKESNEYKLVLLRWIGPHCGSGGYATEARTQFKALAHFLSNSNYTYGNKNSIPIQWRIEAVHAGSMVNEEITNQCNEHSIVASNIKHTEKPSLVIQIFHSTPHFWPERQEEISTRDRSRPLKAKEYWIGRTMYETNSVPHSWYMRLISVDEVWVPSEFNRKTFRRFLDDNEIPYSGFITPRLEIIEEALDEHLFNSSVVHSWCTQLFDIISPSYFSTTRKIFLSVIKWERRKGWDILFTSFLEEFMNEAEAPILLVLTHPHHPGSNITNEFHQWINMEYKKRSVAEVCEYIHIIERQLPHHFLPCLYQQVDAYVMTSRGEGWGRPYAEALAMEKPVIGTNATGNLQFMNEKNSCLVSVDETGERIASDWSFEAAGHSWARPLLSSARKCLREVFSHVNHPESKTWKRIQNGRQSIFPQLSLYSNGKQMMDRLVAIVNRE